MRQVNIILEQAWLFLETNTQEYKVCSYDMCDEKESTKQKHDIKTTPHHTTQHDTADQRAKEQREKELGY